MKGIYTLILILISTQTFALSMKEMQEFLKRNDVKYTQLKAGNFALLSIPNQNPILMSDNGRYIIQGDFRIIDNFNKKEVKNATELEQSSRIIKIKSVIPNINEIVSFSYGDKHALKDHILIIDPFHPSTLDIMKQVKQITIKEDVNFNFVLSTTDVSRRQEMTNMHCLLEKADDDRIFDLLEGKIDVGIQKCLSKIKVMKAELFKKMIYETEVPLLINQHGIIYKGLDITNNLKSLL